MKPTIYFEDTHLVVLDKPSGLLSQGEKTGDPNLVDWLRDHFGRHYVGLVHRLDRNTSGMMVVAKRTKSAERLTRALQEGRLIRQYLAWVEGTVSQSVRWTHFLEKNPKTNEVRVLEKNDGKHGKKSVLSARPIQHTRWKGISVTLMEYHLETGRSHQIRVQSSFEGHPLLGDRKYGAGSPGAQFLRLALHSNRLVFPHPMSGETLTFESPLPEELKL